MNSFIAKKLRLAFTVAVMALALICILLGSWLYQTKFEQLIKYQFVLENELTQQLDKTFSADLTALTSQGRLLANVFEQQKTGEQVYASELVYQVNLTDVNIIPSKELASQVQVQHHFSLIKTSLFNLAELQTVDKAFFAWHSNSDTFQLISSQSEFELPSEVLTWLSLYSHQSDKLLDKPFFSPPFKIANTDSNHNYMIYSFGSKSQQYYFLLQLQNNKLLLFKPEINSMSQAMKYAARQAMFLFLSGLFVLFILLTLMIRILARPTSELIDFIEQQSSVSDVGKPVIPKGWSIWFDKIQLSFQNNRSLLHNLTEKNKELDDKVKVRTRELMQQTFSKDRNLALNQAMMNTIPDSLYYKNLSGGYLGCNKAYEALIGLTEAELVAKTAADIFEPEKAFAIERVEQNIITSNEVHIEQETIISEDGESRLIRWLYSAITSSTGEALGILGLGQDITEQQTSMEKLAFSAEQAEKANQIKGEFIANISHEIRTPMNSIIGMLQLVQGSSVDSSQQSYLKIAETSAQNLLSVINNILDFSKASAEKLEVESATFSISKVLESSFANSMPKAMEKGILLDIQLPKNFPEYLQGDEVKLGQIFTNLIGNAVKFTEQGQVLVTGEVLEQTDSLQQLCFYIRDTGIGIEKQQQKKVFEAFSQADSSVTRKYGGTGLGLTITCQLVELLNGSIELESQVGVGTVFKLSFDFARVPQQPELPSVEVAWFYWDPNHDVCQLLKNKLSGYDLAPQLISDAKSFSYPENSILVCRPEALSALSDAIIAQIKAHRIKLQPVSFSYTTEARTLAELPHLPILTAPVSVKSMIINAAEKPLLLPSQAVSHAPQLSGVKVLVVEDNKINQQVLTLMLKAEGANAVVTNNGSEAIATLEHEHFELILSDIQMPVMDGISLVKQLRKEQNTIPFVIVSAHASDNDIADSISAGADEHIAKPINKQRLIEVITRLLVQSKQDFTEQLSRQINIDFLLGQFNQSIPIATKVLLNFYQAQQQDVDTFCCQAANLEFNTVRRKVHSYKGMLGNIGAESAYQATAELERQLIANKQVLQQDLLHWQKQIEQLFEAIKQLK